MQVESNMQNEIFRIVIAVLTLGNCDLLRKAYWYLVWRGGLDPAMWDAKTSNLGQNDSPTLVSNRESQKAPNSRTI